MSPVAVYFFYFLDMKNSFWDCVLLASVLCVLTPFCHFFAGTCDPNIYMARGNCNLSSKGGSFGEEKCVTFSRAFNPLSPKGNGKFF